MSFNPSIPLQTDYTLQSASQIKANFQAINIAFADNHVGLTQDVTEAGQHNVLMLQPQTTDPITSSTQVALYNKLVSSVPELFFAPSAALTPIQMTYPSILTGIDPSSEEYYAQQYSFIPGPFIIYGGLIATPSRGMTITLTPGTTLLYVDLIVADSEGSPVTPFTAAPTNITGTSFTVSYSTTLPAGSFNVYYLAIGM